MNNSDQSNANALQEEVVKHSVLEPLSGVNAGDLPKYVFRLYVAGNSIRSTRAIQMLSKICEQYLPGRYEMKIIDIYQHPEFLEKDQIFAVPTLVKELPPPLQKLIGDMTNTEKVLVALDI